MCARAGDARKRLILLYVGFGARWKLVRGFPVNRHFVKTPDTAAWKIDNHFVFSIHVIRPRVDLKAKQVCGMHAEGAAHCSLVHGLDAIFTCSHLSSDIIDDAESIVPVDSASTLVRQWKGLVFCMPSLQPPHARGQPQSLNSTSCRLFADPQVHHLSFHRAFLSNGSRTRQHYQEFPAVSLRRNPSEKVTAHRSICQAQSREVGTREKGQAHARHDLCGSRHEKKEPLSTRPNPTVFHLLDQFHVRRRLAPRTTKPRSEMIRLRAVDCDAKRAHPRPSHASRPSSDPWTRVCF